MFSIAIFTRRNRPMRRWIYRPEALGILILGLASLALISPQELSGSAQEKSSKAAVKNFQVAYKYYKAGRIEDAIERFRAFLQKYASDPLAPKAKELLVECGVGEEVKIVLEKRKTFSARFKIKEKEVLDQTENALKRIRELYGELEDYFKDPKLEVRFYESQSLYRKKTGLITTAGVFKVVESDTRTLSMRGTIEWFPSKQGSSKDRELTMKSILFHECSHYLNAAYFGGLLPSIFEEGVASFVETRLNTEFYQTRRETDRQRREGEARNGLNAIKDYKSFLKLLESSRGFGRGDLMLQRWYSFCYSIIDFFEEGEIGSRKGSFQAFIDKVSKMAQAKLEKVKGAGRAAKPSRFQTKPLLEDVVEEFYGVSLKEFHKALVQHILKKYKQR